jgi:hypothetical protein
MPVLIIKFQLDRIEITADVDTENHSHTGIFHDQVKPGESFGGFTYDELVEIALTKGQMDADELRV